MALARKNARPITVDGVAYRWTVRSRPTYSQGLADSPLLFAAELADNPAGRLVVALPFARPDNWLRHRSGAVTPALVARCITQAKASGWNPARRGPAFHLRLPEGAPSTVGDIEIEPVTSAM